MTRPRKLSVGLLLLLGTLSLRMLYNHDYTMYSRVYATCIIVNIGVLIWWFWPMVSDADKPKSFQLYPKKWMVWQLKSIMTMVLIVSILFVHSELGAHLNNKWLNYCIDENPGNVVGYIQGASSVSVIGRFQNNEEPFTHVSYTVQGERYLLRIKGDQYQGTGDEKRVMIKYLVSDPEVAVVK